MSKMKALITGASSGIGYELSKLFAQDGYDLVVVARNKQKLNKLAKEFERRYRIKVEVISKDLSIPSSPKEIFEEIRSIEVLVNNAGFTTYGPFYETDLQKELEMIQVNLVSLTHLTKLFLREMIKRGHGKILNIGSTGSFVPCPLTAVYGATKAYVLSFSNALAEELEGTGITVTVLCPGATRTEFFKRAKMEGTRANKWMVMDARRVAEIGYKALMEGKRIVIPGIFNNFQIFLSRFVPRRRVAKIVKSIMSRA
jgi:hypothetical protein